MPGKIKDRCLILPCQHTEGVHDVMIPIARIAAVWAYPETNHSFVLLNHGVTVKVLCAYSEIFALCRTSEALHHLMTFVQFVIRQGEGIYDICVDKKHVCMVRPNFTDKTITTLVLDIREAGTSREIGLTVHLPIETVVDRICSYF